MQLNFKSNESDAEKLLALRDLRKIGVYVVVHCGGCRIIHYGTLEDFNETGTLLALSCPTEKYRIDYEGRSFTQHERQRNSYTGELIKPKDRFQYIPIALIVTVIDNSKIFPRKQ